MEKKALFYGIIHIGSSNLSLRIVEYKNIDNINVIEEVKNILLLEKRYFIMENCLLILYLNYVKCLKD